MSTKPARTRPHLPSADAPAPAPNAHVCRCTGCAAILGGTVDRLEHELRRTRRASSRTKAAALAVAMDAAARAEAVADR